MINGRKIG